MKKINDDRLKKYMTKIVIDTSIILNRPAFINDLLSKFDDVYIPDVVLREINYQKDHGKPQIKQKAWLVLNSIGDNKHQHLHFPKSKPAKVPNDEKIASIAVGLAESNPNDQVFMVANDVYFPLLTKGLSNLKMLSLEEYAKEFPENGNFDTTTTQNFVNLLKKADIEKLKTFKSGKKIDINFIDTKTGFTPLIIAVRSKNINIINFIIDNYIDKIDLNKHDKFKYGFTPTLHAVQMKRLDIIKLLFKAGADVDVGSIGKNAGNTPLMVCAWHGFDEGVNFFIENGACTNQQDSNGFTALTKACIKVHFNVVKLLIDKTDLQIRSRDNKKAFEYIERGKPYSEKCLNLFKKMSL